MPLIPMTMPSLPEDEALKVARPASSAAALPLVLAPAYTLGLRAIRSHTHHFTLRQWQDDLVADPAETRRVLYRPSPLARRLWVGCWVGTNWRGLTGGRPAKVELQVSLIDDAALAPVGGSASLALGRPLRPAYTGHVWQPIPAFEPDDSDLNSGLEQLASAPWQGLDITGLNGLDGWVVIRAAGLSVLSTTWVELVEASAA